jgi:hypothetical protein
MGYWIQADAVIRRANKAKTGGWLGEWQPKWEEKQHGTGNKSRADCSAAPQEREFVNLPEQQANVHGTSV